MKAVQFSSVWCSSVQFIAVRCSSVRYSAGPKIVLTTGATGNCLLSQIYIRWGGKVLSYKMGGQQSLLKFSAQHSHRKYHRWIIIFTNFMLMAVFSDPDSLNTDPAIC
jgi:hypothetical protein